MKYFIALMFLLRFGPSFSQGQTHFDTMAQMSYCNITPIKVYRNDSLNCNKVYARIVEDNLSTRATLYYELRDSLNIVHQSANIIVGDTCYVAWQANTNWYVFKYLSYSWILNLTLQP